MSWLFKSDWAASPRNPANADLDNIAKDIKTWGGNVDGGGNSLVNLAGLTLASGNLRMGTNAFFGQLTADANSALTIASGSSANTRSAIVLHDSYNGVNNNGGYVSLSIGNGSSVTECMRAIVGGLVGIGTPTPLSLLGVRGVSTGGNTGDAAFFGTSADSALGVVVARSGVTNPRELWLGVNQATGYAEIQAAQGGVGFNTPLCLNRSGGNVGIGTANPQGPLHVPAYGSIFGSYGVALSPPPAAANTNVLLYMLSSTSWAGMGASVNGDIFFRTGLSGTPDVRLCIMSGGNVGICQPYPWAGLGIWHATSTPGGGSGADCALSLGDSNIQLTAGVCSSPSWGTWLQSKHYSANNSPYPIWLNPAGGGVIQNAPANWAGDGVLGNSQVSIWYDESNNRLAFRVRSSAGVLKTGYVSVS
jgi:hypothetical protein